MPVPVLFDENPSTRLLNGTPPHALGDVDFYGSFVLGAADKAASLVG